MNLWQNEDSSLKFKNTDVEVIYMNVTWFLKEMKLVAVV